MDREGVAPLISVLHAKFINHPSQVEPSWTGLGSIASQLQWILSQYLPLCACLSSSLSLSVCPTLLTFLLPEKIEFFRIFIIICC